MKKGKNIPVESVLNHNPFQNLPPLKCKNSNQKLLAAAIKNKDVVMCTGPAGCGKTHVALLQALLLLNKEPDNYDKIVLIKSVTTVKEEAIGFIPGSVEEKMDPYMFSFTYLIDKIFNKKGKSKDLIGSGLVEVMPLAFIRGVNIERAIIIIDEAQNLTMDLFKTTITRLGEGSKIILLGDIEQIDMDRKSNSGFEKLCNLFNESNIVKIVRFTDEDCVRNPIIPEILKTLRE